MSELHTDSASGIDKTSVDELIAAALAYDSPERLKSLLEFTIKLRRYSPYNAMLLHIQNPESTMIATPRDWRKRYKRKVRPDGRPLVILAPMHPVMFVYDIKDTDGPPLPEAVQMEMKDPFQALGWVPDNVWEKTLSACENLKITLQDKPLSENQAGQIERIGDDRFSITLNRNHTREQKYATMVHELGHLFLGHIGESSLGWWKSRCHMGLQSRELEAEIVSYLVCSRLGFELGSDKYLAGYLKGALPDFSLDCALKAAGKIEEMGRGKLRKKKVNSQ